MHCPYCMPTPGVAAAAKGPDVGYGVWLAHLARDLPQMLCTPG